MKKNTIKNTVLVGLFIIYREIKNPALKIVLSVMLIALNYFAYSEKLACLAVPQTAAELSMPGVLPPARAPVH